MVAAVGTFLDETTRIFGERMRHLDAARGLIGSAAGEVCLRHINACVDSSLLVVTDFVNTVLEARGYWLTLQTGEAVGNITTFGFNREKGAFELGIVTDNGKQTVGLENSNQLGFSKMQEVSPLPRLA